MCFGDTTNDYELTEEQSAGIRTTAFAGKLKLVSSPHTRTRAMLLCGAHDDSSDNITAHDLSAQKIAYNVALVSS